MYDQYSNESLLDIFLFEATQLLEQVETCMLDIEKTGYYSQDTINEILRIMHTIKGSSAMMRYENISTLAHSMEDLFYFLREDNPKNVDYSTLSDLMFENVDFIKTQVEKIKGGNDTDDDASRMITKNREFLATLKGLSGHNYTYSYKAVIFFKEGSKMENVRAFNVIHNLENIAGDIWHIPEDIMNPAAAETIRHDGFTAFFKSNYSYVDIHQLLMQTIFLKELELEELEQISAEGDLQYYSGGILPTNINHNESNNGQYEKISGQMGIQQQSIISVTVSKLDKLMNLMGEFVIAEAMVIQNPDLKGLELDDFQKAARQLNKITGELQDVVMSIRMVPLSATFHKMNRIIRDMSKRLNKNVELKIKGEETEVDKNIIEHISDPLMHLVRNAVDHGLELSEVREKSGKPAIGTITLEARSTGSDVLITVKDDGQGLNKKKILDKASKHGLLTKPEAEMIDKEIYNLILLPGFSTNSSINEFSGRGVGMDVVTKNIEAVGGTISIDSAKGAGTTIILKIPLTLAIIDGMNINIGSSIYTIPTINIRESFRPKISDVITDPDNNEMIMVRGECYPILRLHEVFGIETQITKFGDGIFIIIEQDERRLCLFVDKLLGQQQIVVKALPEYVKNRRRFRGLAGCTLLGDGSISLILDVSGLLALMA